jgi:hypothetical protein
MAPPAVLFQCHMELAQGQALSTTTGTSKSQCTDSGEAEAQVGVAGSGSWDGTRVNGTADKLVVKLTSPAVLAGVERHCCPGELLLQTATVVGCWEASASQASTAHDTQAATARAA